jgi:hypothetical protein
MLGAALNEPFDYVRLGAEHKGGQEEKEKEPDNRAS